jgi:hypothetical protein
MVTRREAQIAAFDFLRNRSESEEPFTIPDLKKATGWKPATIRTYLTKQFRGYIRRDGQEYRVRAEFKRVNQSQFLSLVTQNRQVHSEYRRVQYGQVLSFEFLLPMSHETKLRAALDELFYRDTLEARFGELGEGELEKLVPMSAHESRSDRLARACDFAAQIIGGYSVSHVTGRFRASDLLSKAMAAASDRYLVDETTAVVRFEIPCMSTRTIQDQDFAVNGRGPVPAKAAAALDAEISRIRRLFLSVFAEAIVKRVQGEDAIWLIEDGAERRLYVWERLDESKEPDATERSNGSKVPAAARPSRQSVSNDNARSADSDSGKAKPREPRAPKGGQSGDYIPALTPNKKELSVALFLLDHPATSLTNIAAGCFAHEPATRGNSWTRNSLRRLVRARWAANRGRGIYELTAVGKSAVGGKKARARHA